MAKAAQQKKTEESQRMNRRQGWWLLEEIGRIIAQTPDADASVQQIVDTIAEHMSMEVCSIYLYDPESHDLALSATHGLDPSSVGNVRMNVDEGLTGIVAQTLQPVMAVDALAHPRYKYFPETGEERYHSFLGVPVVERGQLLGALVVQTSRRRRFTLNEVRLFKAIATPVAGLLSQVKLHQRLASKEKETQSYAERLDEAVNRLATYEEGKVRSGPAPKVHTRLAGFAASPGFGIGRAHLMKPEVSFADIQRERKNPAKRERARLRLAVRNSIHELQTTRRRIEETVPEVDAAVFDTQRLMLQDDTFVARIDAHIREGMSAEGGLAQTIGELSDHFEKLDDEYFKDRSLDIRDIGQRVLRHLLGVGERMPSFKTSVVLVATDVALSDLAMVEHENLQGVVLASGGVTSHASILAKSLEIPTVVGVEHAETTIREGDHLIVDGNAGVVYVNPPLEVVREYERLAREARAFTRDLERLRDLPAETLDGHHVTLSANIALLADVHLARLHGADGIGLYRTELPFLSHRDFLTEDEQLDLYKRLVTGMEGRPVTIRTLDLGADKYPRYMNVPREDNPFLGWRSIRISLEMPQVFKTQLRAILRASALGPVRVMFPMISSLEEIRQVKWILAEAQQELTAEGIEFDPVMPVGMMLEVPSAVYLAPYFAEEVDFFSIGTNDLIQYVLAVDRNNRKVGPLYEPLHPAVLQCVANAIAAANRAGKRVSLCGEMAADPTCTLVLVGLGLDDLSAGPFFIPAIKRLIRAVRFEDVQRMAEEVLTLPTVSEVKGCIFETIRELGLIDVMEMYR
jgi:phosphotransferase system enzyme I (PtsP)